MGTEHTQGSLTKEAIRLAWPAVCESFFIALAGMVDTFMVSTLGADAVAAVIISALTVGFADQIIEFCGSSEDTHAMAARYYRIIMGGMIFNVLSMGINAAQRGAGNTMIALRTNLISNLVNICGILHFRIYSGTGNDRYLDGYFGRSGIQIPVRVDSVPTGKMGDN